MLKDIYFKKLLGVQQNVYKQILNGICTRQGKIRVSQLPDSMLLEYLSMDHPELFYCDFSNILIQSENNKYYVNVRYLYSETQSKQIVENAKMIADKIISTDQERSLRNLHNYFIKNIKYDTLDYGNTENHSVVGPLIKGKGVCEGISKTIQYILTLCGIDSTVITGYLDDEPHMWNIVSINNYNYHIDVTSDISLTEPYWDKPGYFYYLITDKEIRKTHNFKENFNCIQTMDNPFYKTKKYFNDDMQLINYINNIPRTQRIVYFKYWGNKDNDEIMKLVLDCFPTFLLPTKIYMKEAVGTFYFYR